MLSGLDTKKLTTLAIGLICVGLLVGGVSLRHSEQPATVTESGMGGPAEPPLALGTVGFLPKTDGTDAVDRYLPALAGSFVATDLAYLPIDELGPISRSATAPKDMVIAPRQTFYEALAARGVPHNDIMALVKACGDFRNLRNVRSGEVFRVDIADDGGLRSLGFDLDEESYIVWHRDGDTYRREDGNYPVTRQMRGIAGTITHSLYASLQQLDAPLALAAKMNDILGWDIDFSRDLRKGDTFGIIYEEVWKNGNLVRRVPSWPWRSRTAARSVARSASPTRTVGRAITIPTARTCRSSSCARLWNTRVSAAPFRTAASIRSSSAGCPTTAWITPLPRARRSGPPATAWSRSPAARRATAVTFRSGTPTGNMRPSTCTCRVSPRVSARRRGHPGTGHRLRGRHRLCHRPAPGLPGQMRGAFRQSRSLKLPAAAPVADELLDHYGPCARCTPPPWSICRRPLEPRNHGAGDRARALERRGRHRGRAAELRAGRTELTPQSRLTLNPQRDNCRGSCDR